MFDTLKNNTGAPHRVRLVRFLPYQIFLLKMSFFIILFRIWKWVSSSILNSKINSEAYFSHSSSFASIWCKGRKAMTFDCHILLEKFSCSLCSAMTSYTNLIWKSNVLFISVVCRRVLLHIHKKRKDSLETRVEPDFFSLQLEFLKLL